MTVGFERSLSEAEATKPLYGLDLGLGSESGSKIHGSFLVAPSACANRMGNFYKF